MASYTAWVHIEVEIDGDFQEIGGSAMIFKSENLGEMVKFLRRQRFVPGYSLDIEEEAVEIEKEYING